jgi:hypothetical protein
VCTSSRSLLSDDRYLRIAVIPLGPRRMANPARCASIKLANGH